MLLLDCQLSSDGCRLKEITMQICIAGTWAKLYLSTIYLSYLGYTQALAYAYVSYPIICLQVQNDMIFLWKTWIAHVFNRIRNYEHSAK